jgi:hypothetical protein
MTFGTRQVDICGYYGETYPVSEARLKVISKVLSDCVAIQADYADKDALPRAVVGRIRRMKVESMVKFPPGVKIPNETYESEDFPLSVLGDLTSFFLANSNPV